MMAHTPEPWIADVLPGDNGGYYIRPNGKGQAVANVLRTDRDTNVALKARVNLICASQETLETLKAVEYVLALLGQPLTRELGLEESDGALLTVRSAISRAEGRA